MDVTRCKWAHDVVNHHYHDNEWCKPNFDDKYHFEMLILEGMQAGLSWATVLRKRDNFKRAFDNFDPLKISKYDQTKVDSLLNDAGIIRNKLKIKSAINNAEKFLQVQKKHGSFSKFIWRYVDNKPIINIWENTDQMPATSEISDKISKDLKKLGFSFVGSTIMYSYMQAVGMVNDHQLDCSFR